MSDFVVFEDRLHHLGCPTLEGVDTKPATPADYEHATRCRRCTDGTSTSREMEDRYNDEHLMTDGGVELRDGETRDDSHARRNAEALADLRRQHFNDLTKSEQAVLELLVAAGGQLRAYEVKSLATHKTGLTTKAILGAADRLVEKDLLARAPVPTKPRQTRWLVTDDGRAWVRAGGDHR